MRAERALVWVAATVGAVTLSMPAGAVAGTSSTSTASVSATSVSRSTTPVSSPARGPAGVGWNTMAKVQLGASGRARSRAAFEFRYLNRDRVTANNRAVAMTRCARCRAVALSFQVGIVNARSPLLRATNAATAVNRGFRSTAYAAAGQFLLVTDRPMRLSAAGQRRLADVDRRLERLAASGAPIGTIDAGVTQLAAEVDRILSTETRQARVRGVAKMSRVNRDGHGHGVAIKGVPSRISPLARISLPFKIGVPDWVAAVQKALKLPGLPVG